MTVRQLPFLAAVLVLSGCIPAWVNPTRDDAATLTFVPETAADVLVTGFANGKECRTRMNVAGFGNLKAKTEIKIPPGEEFTALAFFAGGNMRCSVALSFLPKPREAYVAVIDGSAMRCRMGIFHPEGKKLVPEPTARARKWKQPFWSNSEAQCQ